MEKHSPQEDLELIKRSTLASSFSSMNGHNEEVKHKIEEEETHKLTDEKIHSFEEGYQVLMDEITTYAQNGHYSNDPEIQPIPIENFQLSPEKIQTIEEMVKTEPISSTAIHDYCDFSTDIQMVFYEIATGLYDRALYEKAIAAFTFLTTINSKVQAFWIGLGLGYEKNLALAKAIEKFKMASSLDLTDFSPYYGIIRCYEELKQYKEIKELLEGVKENEAIKEEVAVALEYLATQK